jgi:hypothetical protein
VTALLQSANAQAPAPEAALDAQKVALNMIFEGSEGVVRLNGIPIERFGTQTPLGGGKPTLSVKLTGFGVNGANTFKIEIKPKGQAKVAATEVMLIDVSEGGYEALERALAHPLFHQKVSGAGTVEHTVTLRNVPSHPFDDATPWKGSPDALLAEVRALHKHLAARDSKALAVSLRSVYETSPGLKSLGSYDEILSRLEDALTKCTVADLPSKLKVESFYDGRLLRVSGEDGGAPVRLIGSEDGGAPETVLELGAFWSYRHGAWLPLGQ